MAVNIEIKPNHASTVTNESMRKFRHIIQIKLQFFSKDAAKVLLTVSWKVNKFVVVSHLGI